MKRAARITLEALGPPLLAATILELAAVVALREVAALKLYPLFLAFGYFAAGLPSLLFAAVLELAFARGLRPDGLRAVALAAALGAASGLPIDMTLAGAVAVRPSAAFFVAFGFLVGGLIGLLVRARSRLARDGERDTGSPGR